MPNLVFAAISPHPPILLPSRSFKQDRLQVKKTIKNLEDLGKKLKKVKPDLIIISSPHSDWGFNVPLYFLARDFKGKIKTYLTGLESPKFYFDEGARFLNKSQILNRKIALIASGDLSHCLKKDVPYGLHPDGPKFDRDLIEYLKKKDIEGILKLDDLYPQAGQCGFGSFCFMLGILQASGLNWQPEILSYEWPFGVGYLVVNFRLSKASLRVSRPSKFSGQAAGN